MKIFLDILRGCAIGIANIIPGVSGGTLAVSMGIYDKILEAVTGLFKQFKKSLLTLLPYGIGVVIGLVGLSLGIEYLFAHFPLPTALLFIGLILGGVPVIFRHIKGKKVGIIGILLFIAFFAILILLPLIAGNERTDLELIPGIFTAVKLFFIGMLASATMIIPGVSGSMILMSIGYYSPIISSINDFVRALTVLDITALLTNAALLVPFGIGVLLGIFYIAKLITFLLKKFEVYTYCAVLGLVMASPYAILTSFEFGSVTPVSVIIGILMLLIGGIAAYFLGRSSGQTEE